MANKTIDELTAAGTITGDELLHLLQGGNSRKATLSQIAAALAGITSAQTWATPFRGALLTRATDYMDFDENTPILAPWEQAEYDTDGFFSLTQPTRITIPTGVHKVRISGQVALPSSITAHSAYVTAYKNGLPDYPGQGVQNFRQSADGFSNNVYQTQSAIIPVVAGDYFELRLYTSGALGLMDDILAPASWFQVEVIEGSAVEV